MSSISTRIALYLSFPISGRGSVVQTETILTMWVVYIQPDVRGNNAAISLHDRAQLRTQERIFLTTEAIANRRRKATYPFFLAPDHSALLDHQPGSKNQSPQLWYRYEETEEWSM